MSNALDDSLEKVLNELPGRVSNQLLLGAIIETRTQLRNDVSQLSEQVTDLDERLEQLEIAQGEHLNNPSLIWLMRYRPATMIKGLIVVLSVFGLANLPAWVGWLINILGG